MEIKKKKLMKKMKNSKSMTTETKSTTSKGPPLSKFIYDMSSDDYHSSAGSFSSSQLKDVLTNPENFYRKHVAKEIAKKGSDAFDVGNFFHMLVLEPHKKETDFAVFKGIKRGRDWDNFRDDNEGKILVSASQMEQAKSLAKAVENCPLSSELSSAGNVEVSVFIEIQVCNATGIIYAPAHKSMLSLDGWVSYNYPLSPKNFTSIVVKARADVLANKYILDLKSTSGDAQSKEDMMGVVKRYGYNLSAALYLDLFSLVKGIQLDKFYLTFASKTLNNCKTYELSALSIRVGRAKVMQCLRKIAQGVRTAWEFPPEIGVIDPYMEEVQMYLQQDNNKENLDPYPDL